MPLSVTELHRVCTDEASDAFLQAVLEAGTGAANGNEMVLLQSQGSFFSYAPVLRALQHADLPLARYLAYPHNGVHARPHSMKPCPLAAVMTSCYGSTLQICVIAFFS